MATPLMQPPGAGPTQGAPMTPPGVADPNAPALAPGMAPPSPEDQQAAAQAQMAGPPSQQPLLDNAATAGGAQQVDPDAVTFTTMVAGLREHVFGNGEAGIVQRMQQADDPGRVLGEIVFALVHEAATQAEKAGHELSMDILMGVATELIDDVTELLAAHGMQLSPKAREYALLVAQQLYVENSNPDQQERDTAKQALAGLQQDGSVNMAVQYVQQRGTEAGADPFGVQQMRPDMMGGK